jgi:fused signal recognition particle receptor
MVLGVNGAGKTTTLGKIAHQYSAQGKKILIGAADTFRAAAVEQLEIWAQRAGADLIKQSKGSDPSAVAFDTVHAAKARNADLVFIDTAGRLHTKVNLMEELKKLKRIVNRECPGAPHEILLVLDATTGQNAISQANLFHEAVGVTGIALTKLDGTAKGGIIIGITEEFRIPIRYIGVGEGMDDLREFNADEFVQALF